MHVMYYLFFLLCFEIPGGVAYWDDQLKPDDHILKINDQDMTFGTQEQAVNIIKVCDLLKQRLSLASYNVK